MYSTYPCRAAGLAPLTKQGWDSTAPKPSGPGSAAAGLHGPGTVPDMYGHGCLLEDIMWQDLQGHGPCRTAPHHRGKAQRAHKHKLAVAQQQQHQRCTQHITGVLVGNLVPWLPDQILPKQLMGRTPFGTALLICVTRLTHTTQLLDTAPGRPRMLRLGPAVLQLACDQRCLTCHTVWTAMECRLGTCCC
jgi:hypothetical protein